MRNLVLTLTAAIALLAVACTPEEPKKVEVTGVKLSLTTVELIVDGTQSITASVEPADATDKKLTWSSSDEAVAKVDQSGKVTAVAPGTATITAKSTNGKSASCKVTVAAKEVPVQSVDVSFENSDEDGLLEAGDKLKLTVQLTPSEATDLSVTWSSSDETVATVDQSGEVTAVAPGSATITATTPNVKTASIDIEVIVSVSSISITDVPGAMTIGDSHTVTVTISPENATESTILWSSSDETVATVDQSGTVTAVATGEATITATTSNGKSASFNVTVIKVDIYYTSDGYLYENGKRMTNYPSSPTALIFDGEDMYSLHQGGGVVLNGEEYFKIPSPEENVTTYHYAFARNPITSDIYVVFEYFILFNANRVYRIGKISPDKTFTEVEIEGDVDKRTFSSITVTSNGTVAVIGDETKGTDFQEYAWTIDAAGVVSKISLLLNNLHPNDMNPKDLSVDSGGNFWFWSRKFTGTEVEFYKNGVLDHTIPIPSSSSPINLSICGDDRYFTMTNSMLGSNSRRINVYKNGELLKTETVQQSVQKAIVSPNEDVYAMTAVSGSQTEYRVYKNSTLMYSKVRYLQFFDISK